MAKIPLLFIENAEHKAFVLSHPTHASYTLWGPTLGQSIRVKAPYLGYATRVGTHKRARRKNGLCKWGQSLEIKHPQVFLLDLTVQDLMLCSGQGIEMGHQVSLQMREILGGSSCGGLQAAGMCTQSLFARVLFKCRH